MSYRPEEIDTENASIVAACGFLYLHIAEDGHCLIEDSDERLLAAVLIGRVGGEAS